MRNKNEEERERKQTARMEIGRQLEKVRERREKEREVARENETFLE